jgi:hypothetical protein
MFNLLYNLLFTSMLIPGLSQGFGSKPPPQAEIHKLIVYPPPPQSMS